MREATSDPTVFIVGRVGDTVTYESADGNERWEITGTCNCCGACYTGGNYPELEWTGVPVGQAGACRDITYGSRLDVPVRPEIKQDHPCCVLTGRYL